MKLNDTYTFNAEQQVVWDVLMNPAAIAEALPGVDRLIPFDDVPYAWRATAKLGVANISGTYVGVIRMTELHPPNSYRLSVSGEGQQSIINGSALLTMSYDPETKKTLLSYDADATLSGRLAGIGQRLVHTAAKMLARQFFGKLARQLVQAETGNTSDAAADETV